MGDQVTTVWVARRIFGDDGDGFCRWRVRGVMLFWGAWPGTRRGRPMTHLVLFIASSEIPICVISHWCPPRDSIEHYLQTAPVGGRAF